MRFPEAPFSPGLFCFSNENFPGINLDMSKEYIHKQSATLRNVQVEGIPEIGDMVKSGQAITE